MLLPTLSFRRMALGRCVCVCVCLCVRESFRERERERERDGKRENEITRERKEGGEGGWGGIQ